jgi:pantothenate kinase
MNDNDVPRLELEPAAALDFLVRETQAQRDRHAGRIAIGLAGGPGVGKSTLATELVARLNAETPGIAAYVPMDGFHMLHAKLESLGTVRDKGAPHTFEANAFADFIDGLKQDTGAVKGPAYSREIEDVVLDAFIVPAAVRVLVVEGNYLLLATAPWWRIRPLLDYAAYIDVPRETVRARLMKRHAEHGLFTEERNREHVERVDLANYDIVRRSANRADIVLGMLTTH